MKIFKTSLVALLTVLFILPVHAKTYKIGITQIVEHPALDSCRKGVEDELKAQGLIVGKNLKISFESAQGSPATAAQIARKFVGEQLDLVVGIATPSAQTLLQATHGKIPVVFSAVTDPVGAKLVDSLKKPNKSSGVSDLSPVAEHLKLIKKLVPNVKSIGIVYNAGEANSVTLVKLAKQAAKSLSLKIVEATAAKTAEVQTSAQSLIGKVDAFYSLTDNTIVSAFESLAKVANQSKIPLIAADTDSVKRGAIAALGFNYYDLGRQTGNIVMRVLKGEKVGSIPVETVSKLDLVINMKAAKKQGVTFSQDIIKQAKEIIK